jgi:hypothetical protein
MPIRWDDIPHAEIAAAIHLRLGQNAVGRSAEDASRHILSRRLGFLDAEEHRRFVELESRDLVAHLRCTRDVYREFVEKHNCSPVLEAYWVVLRCAVFPTAIAALRRKVVEYLKLARVPGRDLSLLFGIPTHTCYREGPIPLLGAPDFDDDTAATDSELLSLGKMVNEDTVLWFRDIRDGGAVGRPFGGGPFAPDDAAAISSSWGLGALQGGMTLTAWISLRKKIWHLCAPWSDGLFNLFGSVQEELLSQWRALPPDSRAYESTSVGQPPGLKKIVVSIAGEKSIASEWGTGKGKKISKDKLAHFPAQPRHAAAIGGSLGQGCPSATRAFPDHNHPGNLHDSGSRPSAGGGRETVANGDER